MAQTRIAEARSGELSEKRIGKLEVDEADAAIEAGLAEEHDQKGGDIALRVGGREADSELGRDATIWVSDRGLNVQHNTTVSFETLSFSARERRPSIGGLT